MIIRHLVKCLGALIITLMPSLAMAQNIGSVASVTNQMTANSQPAFVGFDLSQNDNIVTNRTGRGQLLFNDQTTLTVAPSSNLVLDQFVYDASNDAGEIALDLTKGALRFIGGNITKNTTATITTPTGTIGIRGGMALIISGPEGVRAIFLAGERMCVTVDGNQSCTSRRGGILTQDGYQGEVSERELAALITRIDGPLFANSDEGDTALGGLGELFTPFEGDISTKGENRSIVIIEQDIDGFLRNPPGDDQSDDKKCIGSTTSC